MWGVPTEYRFKPAEETPMRVLNLSSFLRMGRIMRESECRRLNLLTDFDKALGANRKKRRNKVVVFIAHRWLNSDYGKPDDDFHIKYQLLTRGLKNLRKQLASKAGFKPKIYIWIDYSCLPQDSTVVMSLGIASLPAYIERCDAVLTPVLANSCYTSDELSNVEALSTALTYAITEDVAPEQREIIRKYAHLTELLSRSWIRLEMYMAATVVFDPQEHFAVLECLGNHRKDRPHFLISPEPSGLDPLIVLPRLSAATVALLAPLQGELFDSSDKEKIEKAIEAVEVSQQDQVQARVVFDGEVDSEGHPHGRGCMTYSDGSRFEGVFEHGIRKSGTQFYASGNQYKGEWENDKPHGFGCFTYVSGDFFEGEFKDGSRTGTGKYVYKGAQVTYFGYWKNSFPDPSFRDAHYEKDGRTFKTVEELKENLDSLFPEEKPPAVDSRTSCLLM